MPGSIVLDDTINCSINRSMGDFNVVGDFIINLDNPAGRHSNDFNINDTIDIFADLGSPAATKIFTGIVDNIRFVGRETRERMTITGKDFGKAFQDIQVQPRIFKDKEISDIVRIIIRQNIPASFGITTNNVNSTGITVEKIVFNNINVFDALKQLAELAKFYFYIDENKDLHFEGKESLSTGQLLDNSNVVSANFRTTDSDTFNFIKVVGDRQLTGARETFNGGPGSVYTLQAKPHNTTVSISGTAPLYLFPGGVFNFSNPSVDNVKYLVDFDNKFIILTSGTAAGNNIYPTGSTIIFDYQRSTPIIVTKQSISSIDSFRRKDKTIIDKNIKTLSEANDVANTFLTLHSGTSTMGKVDVKGIWDLVPGRTINVFLPWENQSGTFTISNIQYEFDSLNNLTNNVQTVSLNAKIPDIVDTIKKQELRLRKLEGTSTDISVTILETVTGSIGISGTSTAIVRSIGSSFYFHITNHDILNSPSSLLGDMRAGSNVWIDGIKQ